MFFHDPYLFALLGLMLASVVVGCAGDPPLMNDVQAGERESAPAVRVANADSLEGSVESVNVEERSLVVATEGGVRRFVATPSAQVTRDGRDVEFVMLAPADFVVLTLARNGSDVVVRIQAVSRR